MDSYTHMSRMEDQVKLFEVQVKDLKEKLTLAHSEINTKESLILQHAKVAEEAVSGKMLFQHFCLFVLRCFLLLRTIVFCSF